MTTQTLSSGPTLESLGDGPGVVVDDNTAKFDARPGSNGEIHISRKPDATPAPQADSLIAGKFKTQDDLVKAYKELEAKLGAPKPAEQPKPEASAEAKPNDLKMGNDEQKPADTPKPDEGEQPAEAQGEITPLDFTTFSNEFFEKGELSEDSYAKLAKDYKLDKGVVDTFIEGQKAIAQVRGQSLHEAAGGKDAYDALVKWGTQSLPQAEKDAFNRAVDTAITTGDTTAASLLIAGLKAKMGGGEPNYVATQNRNGEPAVQPFANRSEMTAAMRDPRYRKDPAYVAEVQARLAVSPF